MLELRNVSIKIKKNDRFIIDNFNFVLNKGYKVAIIGEEGNGKSTLLKFIYNNKLIDDYCWYEGEVIKRNLKIGFLEQQLNNLWDNTPVFEFFLKNNSNDEIDYDRYTDLAQASSILSKFKINLDLLDSEQLINTLSGGEKVKIQLAKLIINNNDVLLLDEPTNDLDIETLEWLEEFIKLSNIPIMFVSHDETLLERTANVIIHLEQIKRKRSAKHNIEKMGYRDYIEKRLGGIKKQKQIAKKQRADYQIKMEEWRKIYQKVDYQQKTITRADPHGAKLLKKKMKALKSQEKRINKESNEFLDIPDVEEAINFDFNNDIYIPNGKCIIDLNIPKLMIDNKILINNIDLKIYGPIHVILIGKNGIGKTTLLKYIYNEIKNRIDIKVGYMPQNYEDLIDPNLTALNFICPKEEKEAITKARSLMGRMKFTNEEMISLTNDLSGGQKAKLLLLKMILDKCNVLLLDEPTRNLSPLSNPVIREVLANYKGTIFGISHDREFINEVADIVYEVTFNGLKIVNCFNNKINEKNKKR